MSGPETGGPPSGPRADRWLSLLDAAVGRVLDGMKPITDLHAQLTGGAPMRGNPHPQPSQPSTPPPPRLRH